VNARAPKAFLMLRLDVSKKPPVIESAVILSNENPAAIAKTRWASTGIVGYGGDYSAARQDLLEHLEGHAWNAWVLPLMRDELRAQRELFEQQKARHGGLRSAPPVGTLPPQKGSRR